MTSLLKCSVLKATFPKKVLVLCSFTPAPFPIATHVLDLLWEALKYSGFTDVYSVLFLQWEAMDQGEK